MQIGVMNHPNADLLEEIEWISQNGFDFIDLTIEPLKAYDFDVPRVKKALNASGLEVIGHTNSFLPFILPIDSIREACLKEFRKYVDIFVQKKNLAEDFFKEFGEDIVHLHFSDNNGKKDDHLPLGCGGINWEETVRTVKRFGFDGTITLEVFVPDRGYLLLSRDKLKGWWKTIGTIHHG